MNVSGREVRPEINVSSREFQEEIRAYEYFYFAQISSSINL
jgi:hypothetical protein